MRDNGLYRRITDGMYPNTITFQLSTNYLSKIALRIECLYQAISEACTESHPIIHHYALKNVIELLSIIEKPELKSRLLKELMRIEHSLKKIQTAANTENINLHQQIQTLSHLSGPFGEGMLQDPLLQIFKTAQDYETYPPPLLFWLESKPEVRQAALSLWIKNLKTLFLSVNTYLKLLRSTAEFVKKTTTNGFYQQNLNSQPINQLILMQLDKSLGLIPRMQLGHHGLSVSFFDSSTLRDVKDNKVHFELAICSL